jgi:DNA mismatch repair protein MutS
MLRSPPLHYCRPQVDHSLRLCLRDANHSVLGQNLAEEKSSLTTPILTAKSSPRNHHRPEHGGKSAYIRQVAANRPPGADRQFRGRRERRDRIFTRVGINDDLSLGQSAFILEMNEMANIVKQRDRT